jgi:glycosyltransferase involved in cell wall biosynthesis
MRVMRVLTRPNLGGPTRQAIALWHAGAALGVQTLLVTGVVAGDEAELSPQQGGVPALSFAAALAAGPAAVGHVVVPALGRGLAPWSDHRAGLALQQLLASHRPDVVHTHTSKAGWLGRRAAWRAGVPTVHTFHGHVLRDYFPGWASWLLARAERHLAARTDQLVAVSQSCADELAAAGVAPRARFHVVPPAVAVPPALPRQLARQRLGLPPQGFVAAVVGRLVPIKRIEDFVTALAAVPRAHGDIVGDGPQREALQRLCHERTADRVRCLGARSGIAAELAAYDALVVPSVREGCPLVAIEAFAAGVPVVGYDVPGVRDALAGHGGGLLVDPAAGPAGLAAALRRLRDEPAVAAAAVAAGRAAVARFDPAAIAAALLAIYRASTNGAARYHALPRS